jgi:hypothetical protein
MPISFSCSGCSKTYLVSDGLAGKRATCKACGTRMVIPVPTAAARPVPIVSANEARPPVRPTSARPASVPAAAPVARAVPRRPEPEPPAEDIYGLEEAPSPVAMPPMMPRSAGAAEATVAEAPAKKRKKSGFFSSGKKKSSGRSFQYSGIGVGPIRLIAIIIGAVGAAIGGWGLLPRGQVESFHTTLIAQRAELLSALQPIRDVPSAQAAGPRVQEILARMTKHLEDNGFKKGRKQDVQEVTQKYGARHQADVQRIIQELTRIAMIPGALPALGIDAQLKRLEEVENRIQRAAGS